MDLVFSTDGIEPSRRYAAWQGAICDVYVHVDVNSEKRSDYQGFIREARFGAVTMTDVLLSEQRISRRERHIAKLDKDCYYVEFVQHGKINVLQSGQSLHSNASVGAIFSASEAYDLECIGKVRSLYLEIPRKEFAERFPKIGSRSQATMATGARSRPDRRRVLLDACVGGSCLRCQAAEPDWAMSCWMFWRSRWIWATSMISSADRYAQQARLRSVKDWIEEHLADPDLSPEKIARSNGMSLRHLHYLFRLTDMSVSEWILDRRLQRCYDRADAP